MDTLTSVLQTLNLKTNTYFCTDFSGDWGMEVPYDKVGSFHAVIDGECWIIVNEGEEPIHMSAGDIVAFPTGGSHKIGYIESNTWLLGSDVVAQVQQGSNPFENSPENHATLLCGSFEYDASIQHPFLKDLPCFIHIKSDERNETWLHCFSEALVSESRHPKIGSQAIINSLTEILFVQLIRAYMHQDNNKMKYMSALVHPQIGEALNHIHNDNSANWSVERLADQLAMSRTTFTDKFTRIVGISPKRYMIDWRMQKAKNRLQTSNDAMITIAESAGYTSEAAFGKAYKQFFGETPGMNRTF